MLCNRLLLLLVISFLFSPPLHSISPKKCKAVTRATIEEKFGKPVKCGKNSEGVECFGPQLEPVKVQFDSSDVVTDLEIITFCHGLDSLIKVLDVIVPKNARGKYLQESQPSAPYSCHRVHEEEYQCVRITYSQELCMGCAPASIKASWK